MEDLSSTNGLKIPEEVRDLGRKIINILYEDEELLYSQIKVNSETTFKEDRINEQFEKLEIKLIRKTFVVSESYKITSNGKKVEIPNLQYLKKMYLQHKNETNDFHYGELYKRHIRYADAAQLTITKIFNMLMNEGFRAKSEDKSKIIYSK